LMGLRSFIIYSRHKRLCLDKGADKIARMPYMNARVRTRRAGLRSGQMAAILATADYDRWLGAEPDPRDLLRPFPSDLLVIWPNEPLLSKARAVALHKLPVRPAPETPEQPAFAQVCFNFHLPVPPLLKTGTQEGLCRTNHMLISANPGENEPARHSSPGGINLQTAGRRSAGLPHRRAHQACQSLACLASRRANALGLGGRALYLQTRGVIRRTAAPILEKIKPSEQWGLKTAYGKSARHVGSRCP